MITAALAGLGNVAWKYDKNNPDAAHALSQAGAMLAHPDVRLAGGCSPDAADRTGFTEWSRGVPAFATLEEMLETLRPDLVGICSPTADHFDHARQCLEKGVRLVWLEKPPTARFHELEQLTLLARETGATVCVNYFRRYLPVYQRLRELVLSDAFGTCRLLRVLYSPGLARNGIHFLDQIFFLTGATSCTLLWVERKSTLSPSFAVELSTGLLVAVNGSDVPYHTNDMSFICDEGVLSVLDGGRRMRVERCVEQDLFPGFYERREVETAMAGRYDFDRHMEAALADLVESGTARRPPASNLESAMLAQSLLRDVLVGAGQ